MHSQACRILEIIGLESDLYSKIKGQFGAHDFGAKHHGRDFKLTRSCTPQPWIVLFPELQGLAVRAGVLRRWKKTWRNVEFLLISGKEGDVPGNWLGPSELITAVTQPVSCTFSQCMSQWRG